MCWFMYVTVLELFPPGHQAILFYVGDIKWSCFIESVYKVGYIHTLSLFVYICRYYMRLLNFPPFFFICIKYLIETSQQICVWKYVFISVNKYTYIYILYIWKYIFFRCGRNFFFIIFPVYIYISWELRLIYHTLAVTRFSLFPMLYHFRF